MDLEKKEEFIMESSLLICIFGAGKVGQKAARIFMKEGKHVSYFVDNDTQKWGKRILDIPVICLEDYISISEKKELIIACNDENRTQIEMQLHEKKVKYKFVSEWDLVEVNERIISYSCPFDMEDVILYHALYNHENIFYIDIGSNDPFDASVTKLFYDVKNAHGINVEPQKYLFDKTNIERKRDINLCVGVGCEEGEAHLYIQGGLSTIKEKNVVEGNSRSEKIHIMTLEQICEKYVAQNQNISFLKIDVEGAEREVLEGANFKKFRPFIVVMESTEPGTLIPTYEEWENVLISAKYHFAYSFGVNRYYVADEKAEELDRRFIGIESLREQYDIRHAKLED